MTGKEFDIVIFGATGLAGKYCIEQMAKSTDGLKWAVAGRDEGRMLSCLKEVNGWMSSSSSSNEASHPSVLDTPTIVADVHQRDSLHQMAARANCIINTVGPYTTWGEPMVEACLANGTHMLDLSGELHYNESMRNKYHKVAKEKGIYFIATAGFDSIPAESVLQYARNNFPGRLNTFESFVTFEHGELGAKLNTGTWNSIINVCQNLGLIAETRKKAWGTAFDKTWQKVGFAKKKSVMTDSRSLIPGYIVPFLGGDKPCVTHSEFFRAEVTEGYKRTQIQTYKYQKSMIASFLMAVMILCIMILSQFAFGRYLLTTYPELFSFGTFKKGDPTREQALSCGFMMFGVGQGWFAGEDEKKAPTRKVVVKLHGPEVAYVATSICIVNAAICVVKEADKIPIKGGYLTPGFALEKTSLLDRLMNNDGFDYSVVTPAK